MLTYPAPVEARVFRGIGLARAAARIAALVTAYAGALAVLYALGLVVRGWQGWTLVLAPLAAMIGARLWAWKRVSVEVRDGVVRYEGAAPSRDFEVPLEHVRATYFDRTLRGHPLVLVLDGDERICGELSAESGRALSRHLAELGVSPMGQSD